MTVPFNVSSELLFCSTMSPDASRVSRWLCLDAGVTRTPQGLERCSAGLGCV